LAFGCSALLAAGSASATDISSFDSGDWQDGPTWVGGVLPGSGDTAMIDHIVRVDRDDATNFESTDADVVVNAGGELRAWYGIFTAPSVTLNGGQIAAEQRTHVLNTNTLTINDVAGNSWTQYKNQNSKHAEIHAQQLVGAGTLDILLGRAGQLFQLDVDDTTGFTGELNVSRLGFDVTSGYTYRVATNDETNSAHLKINQSIAKEDASFSMVLNEYTYDWKEEHGGTAALDDGTAYNGYDMRDDSVEVWFTGLTIGGYEVPARESAYTYAELAAMDGGNVANYLRSDGTDGLIGVIGGAPALPGDTDGDGDVDDADLGVAFSNYTGPLAPNTGGKTAADGDADGDGDVDDADLGAAFAAYTGPLASAAVPEPTSLALLGLGGLLAVRRRRG
jgi:hypothetical protein